MSFQLYDITHDSDNIIIVLFSFNFYKFMSYLEGSGNLPPPFLPFITTPSSTALGN